MHRQYVFAQHTTVGVFGYREPYPSRAVRDERYKLIRNLAFENEFWINGIHGHAVYKSWQEDAEKDPGLARRVKFLSHRPEVELYDLKNDPFDQNNLAGQTEYRKIESRLGKELDDWMQQQGDLKEDENLMIPRMLVTTFLALVLVSANGKENQHEDTFSIKGKYAL